MIVLLGVLAAVAVPKFISLGFEARVASVKAMAAALDAATRHAHDVCAMTDGCDINNPNQHLVLAGRNVDLVYGYLNAGDNTNVDQIDTWVVYQGFTLSLGNNFVTEFWLDSAPDPHNCRVSYQEPLAFWTPAFVPYITQITTGC